MKQTDCEGCTKKNVHCWKNHELQKWLCKACKEKPSAVKSGAGTPLKGSPTKGGAESSSGGKKSLEVLVACAMRSLHDIYGLDCDPLIALEEVKDDLMDRFDLTEDQAQDAIDGLSDRGYIESAKGKRERSGEKKKSPKKGKKGAEDDEDSAYQYSGPLLMYSLLGVLQAIRASGRGPVKHEDRPFHGGFIGHALRIKLPYRPKDILYMTTELGTKTGMLTLKAPVYSWGSVEPTNLPDDLKEVERLLAIGEANMVNEEGSLFPAAEKPAAAEKKPATPATGTSPSYAAAAGARPTSADALSIMEGALKDKELAKLFISIITENHCEGNKKSKEVRPLLRSHLQNELFLSKNARVSKDGAVRAKIINAAVDNELLVFDEVLKGGEVRYKFGPAWTGVNGANTTNSSERSSPVPEAAAKTPVKKGDKMKLEEIVTSKAEANELADLLVKLIHKFHLPPTSRPMLRSHLHNELNESGNKLMRNSSLRSEVIELALKAEIITIAKKHPSEILYGLGPNFSRKETGKGKGEKETSTKAGNAESSIPSLPRRTPFRDKHIEAVLNCIEQKWGIEADPPIRRHLLAAELQKKFDLDKTERDSAIEAAIKKGLIKEVDESTKEHLQYQLHGEMADRMYMSGVLTIMKENEDNSHFRKPQSVEGISILLKQLKQKYIYRPELECIVAVEKAMDEGWLDKTATEKVLKKERAAAGEKSVAVTTGDEEYEKEKADAASPYVDSRAAFMDRYAIDKASEEAAVVEVKAPAVKPLFGLGAEIEANKHAECDICQQVPENGESVKKCRCPECVEAISQMSPGGAGAESNPNKGLKLCPACFEYIHPNGAPEGYVTLDSIEPTNPSELIAFLRAKLERTEEALHGKIRRLEQENSELRGRLERSERARKEPDPHHRMVDDLVGLGGDLGLNGLSVAAKPFTPTKAMPPTPPTATTPTTAGAPMTVSAVPASNHSTWGNGTSATGSAWQTAAIPQQQTVVGIPNPAAALYNQQQAHSRVNTQQSPTTAAPISAAPAAPISTTNGTSTSSSSATTWAAIGSGTALSTPWSTNNSNSVW